MATHHPSPAPSAPDGAVLDVVLTGSVAPFSELLAQRLRTRGHRVVQVPSDRYEQAPSVYEVLQERIEPDLLAEAVADADATILLTGLGPLVATIDDAAALDVILATARPGATLIELSSFAVFGDQGLNPIDEDTTPEPAVGTEAVLAAELRTLAAQDWLRTAVVRAGLVYGPGGGTIEALIAAARASGRSQYLGEPTDRYPLIHRDDLLELLLELVENPRGQGTFHAVGELIEAETLAGLIASAAGVEEVSALTATDRTRLSASGRATHNRPGRVNVHAHTTRGADIGWAPTGASLAEEITDHTLTTAPAQQ